MQCLVSNSLCIYYATYLPCWRRGIALKIPTRLLEIYRVAAEERGSLIPNKLFLYIYTYKRDTSEFLFYLEHDTLTAYSSFAGVSTMFCQTKQPLLGLTIPSLGTKATAVEHKYGLAPPGVSRRAWKVKVTVVVSFPP
jgi:hypothetical protein